LILEFADGDGVVYLVHHMVAPEKLGFTVLTQLWL